MTDRVTVLRTLDLAKADLFEQLLMDASVRFLRTGQSPAMLGAGTAAFEHKFDVAGEDAEHARELLAVIERAESGAGEEGARPLGELTESSGFRRLVERLLRFWFYACGGFVFLIPSGLAYRTARVLGVPTLPYLDVDQLPAISVSIAIVASFAPSGWRKWSAVAGMVVILLLAVFATGRG